MQKQNMTQKSVVAIPCVIRKISTNPNPLFLEHVSELLEHVVLNFKGWKAATMLAITINALSELEYDALFFWQVLSS